MPEILGLSAARAESAKGDRALIQTLRKAQGLLRQAAGEKAALEAANAELAKRVQALEDQLRAESKGFALESKRQKLDLERLQSQNAALRSGIDAQDRQSRALSEQNRGLAAVLEKTRRDNQLLVDAVRERTRWIQECSDKNRGLFEANREILARFGDQGFLESIKRVEPLTQIGSVERENAVQDFRFRLEDLQVTPWKEEEEAAAGAVRPEDDSGS